MATKSVDLCSHTISLNWEPTPHTRTYGGGGKNNICYPIVLITLLSGYSCLSCFADTFEDGEDGADTVFTDTLSA